MFLNTTSAYERMVEADPELRFQVEKSVVQRDHAEIALAILDCQRKFGVSTAFAFFSSNQRSTDFEEVAKLILSSWKISLQRVDGTMKSQKRYSARCFT